MSMMMMQQTSLVLSTKPALLYVSYHHGFGASLTDQHVFAESACHILYFITSLHRQVEIKKIKDTDVDEGPTVSRITAILSYSKGFACSVGPGSVCLFEKTEEDGYRKSREIRVSVYTYREQWHCRFSVSFKVIIYMLEFVSDPCRPMQQWVHPGRMPADWHHVHQSSRGDAGHQHRPRTAVQRQPVLSWDEQGTVPAKLLSYLILSEVSLPAISHFCLSVFVHLSFTSPSCHLDRFLGWLWFIYFITTRRNSYILSSCPSPSTRSPSLICLSAFGSPS